ncbi:MAG: hypothetical protein ACYTGZ_08520 [Planctomycetota bacterium]|jgi:hypothetical protein
MRRLLTVLVLLAAIAGLALLFVMLMMPPPPTQLPEVPAPPQAVAAPPNDQQGAVRQKGTLKGTVLYGPTGEPLAGATIIVLAPFLDPGDDENLPTWGDMIEKARLRTGPDGTFLIQDLPPDYYNLWAEKKGYGFTTIPRATFNDGHVIKLWPGATIRGKVVYDDESPAAGVRIEYTPQGTHSEVFSRYRLKSYYTQTKSDGTFEYTDLPPGKFTVEVYPENHLPAPWTTAPPLKAGELRILKTHKLDPGFGMTVHVKWLGTGEPVPGIEVAVRPMGDPMPRTRTGQRRFTNEKGIARFSGLGGQVMPKPTFLVAANVGGEAVMPDEKGLKRPDETVIIHVRRDAIITGKVVRSNGAPLPRFFLDLRAKGFQTSQLQQWITNPDKGKFTMHGVPEGEYTMNVRFPGLIDKSVPIKAVAGQENDIGTIVLEEGAEIWGTVRRDSGKPIEEIVRVVLSRNVGTPKKPKWEPVARAVVQKDGSYRLRGLPTGTFFMQPLAVVNLSTTEPEEVTIQGPTESIQKNLMMYGSGFVQFHYWDLVDGALRRVVAVPTYLVRKSDGQEYRWWGSGTRFRPGAYEIQFEMDNAEGVPTRYKGKTVTIQEDETPDPIEVSLHELRDGE